MNVLGSPRLTATAHQVWHTDLTTACSTCYTAPRCYRRRLTTLRGRRNNSGSRAFLPFAKRAGRVARDVARCRRASSLLTPGFLFARDPPQRHLVPSQLNRDDAHVPDPFRLVRMLLREPSNPYNEEFDPGSGRTLAACLMHASRTHGASGREWRTAEEHVGTCPLWGITARKRC